MRKKVLIIIGIIIVAVIILSQTPLFKKPEKIDSSKVKRENLEETLTISGTIQAEENVPLRFQTSGKLTWVGVKEGDYVKQYQAIASLDQRQVKKQLQTALNNYAKERLDFDQGKKEDHDASNPDSVIRDRFQSILEKNQYDLNNSVIDVELQQLSLEYSTLISPIEGLVVNVSSPFAGVNITPSQAEFVIVNPTTVYFEANADQDEVTKLYEGEVGELTLDSYADNTLSGNIKTIAFMPKTGDSASYPVKFTFTGDNTSYHYRVGMTGDLTFVINHKNHALSVPNKYIKSDSSRKYVFVMKEKKLVKRTVTTGLETDTKTEITSGLSEGDVVYDKVK